ncbi:Pre-mRNA-splicing factor sap61 [Yarrowia sp. B02]|nr:Pre-mRNA-splicing factor sap61 [Yarrowia sp. B02]
MTTRAALEEMEVIEAGIAERLAFNPLILPPSQALTPNSPLQPRLQKLKNVPFTRQVGTPTTHRQTVLRQHEIATMLDTYQKLARQLKADLDAPKDKSGSRNLSSKELKGVLGDFYAKIDKVKQTLVPGEQATDMYANYTLKRPALDVFEDDGEQEETDMSQAESNTLPSGVFNTARKINFGQTYTDAENSGRYLDMTPLYIDYQQQRMGHVGYIGFVKSFYNSDIYDPQTCAALGKKYPVFLESVVSYLESFITKKHILEDPQKTIDSIRDSVKVTEAKADKQEDPELFCKFCDKQFTNQAVYDNHLPGKKHKKAVARAESGETAPAAPAAAPRAASSAARSPDTILAHLKELADFLKSTIDSTVANLERKQALTNSERQAEIAAQQDQDRFTDENLRYGQQSDGSSWTKKRKTDDEDEDEDEVISNPLKLPLGFDGKPIPFWLYKLHGLGIEYTCEICGNTTYKGRKIFDKHFSTPRHIFGLRCLGIEPSQAFKGITKIEEANALWERMKKQLKTVENREENIVEVEDSDGNAMSEKTYEDLKRQGLL